MTTHKDREEFINILAAEKKFRGLNRAVVTALADRLITLAGKYDKLQVLACNRGLTPAQEKREAALEAEIRELCQGFAIIPCFDGDPRGSVVKLKVPSGRTNDQSGEGICVPT